MNNLNFWLESFDKLRVERNPFKAHIIADSLNSLDFSRQKKEQKVSKLSSLKKALMQDLLTGKVRVNVE
jgi:type I restriction enzyme S subunit